MYSRTFSPISIRYLALKNLRRKPLRTYCLVLIVAIFTFTMFGGTLLNEKLRGGFTALAQRLGADILVVPYGYEKNMEGALLRGEPSTFYLKSGLTRKISRIPGVAAASPQLFIASLNSGCCTAKVQLIGFDPATDFTVQPWIQQNTDRAVKPGEIVVGSMIVPGEGEKIKFFGHNFSIAAKMDRTGMGFDTSVFMPLESAHELMREARLVSGDTGAINDFISSVAVKVKSGFEPKAVANEISQAYAVDYNLDIIVTRSMLTDLGERLQNLSFVIYGLSLLLWVLAVVTIFIVFSATLNERKREISLLRVLGASRKQLVKLLFMESLFISIAGTGVGTIGAAVIIAMFGNIIFSSLGLPYTALEAGSVIFYLFFACCVGAFVAPLANIYSVLSITKFDGYSTLREGE